MSVFSDRLKEERRLLGITQPELADSVGVHHTTICSWERGVKSPVLENAVDISKALHISLDYLSGISNVRRMMDESMCETAESFPSLDDYKKLDDRGKRIVDAVLKAEIEEQPPSD